MNEINTLESTKEICSFCNRRYKKLYNFSPCSHKICSSCLYEIIFTKYISQLQGQNIIKIYCKCEIGFSQIKLSTILQVLKEKKNLDLNSPY
jgi:hypothetical protein